MILLGATTDLTGTLDVGATSPTPTADLVTINPRQRASIGIQYFTASTPQPAGGGDFGLFLEIDRVRIGRAVPEPGSMFAMAIASAGMGTRRRRRAGA